MAPTLELLSGGAAHGVVSALSARFRATSGFDIHGSFNAVGAMRDRLLAGEPCDVVILTSALIAQLEASGHVVPGSARALGVVKTGIAVKTGTRQPPVDTPEQLRAALHAATGVYFPDPVKATAGIHFMNVLKQLGLAEPLASRLHTFPNGATAMKALSETGCGGAIGCTQVTEILYTPGVTLVDVLPPEFELATVYTAAVCTQSGAPDAARALVDLLASDEAAPIRTGGGFDPA
jgi:molybdate transport system substrate-binding protein